MSGTLWKLFYSKIGDVVMSLTFCKTFHSFFALSVIPVLVTLFCNLPFYKLWVFFLETKLSRMRMLSDIVDSCIKDSLHETCKENYPYEMT